MMSTNLFFNMKRLFCKVCDGSATTDGSRSGESDSGSTEFDDEAAAVANGDHAQTNSITDGVGDENEK